MRVYILTRFSIFDPHYHGFKIKNNKTHDEYKSNLFSKRRLDSKFSIFEKMTLPSIVNQTYKDWEWHIFTSKELPKSYKLRLESLISSYPNIKILYINSFKQFTFTTPPSNLSFCTLRLDDDDGLHTSFLNNIQQYENKKNSVVSHSNGICFTLEDNKILYGDKREFPCIGLGLCGIGFNIYQGGNHNSIHKRYNVIYNEKSNMWYLAHDKYCDSGRKNLPRTGKSNLPRTGKSNLPRIESSKLPDKNNLSTLYLEAPYYKILGVLNKTLNITKDDVFYKDTKELVLNLEIMIDNNPIMKTYNIRENETIVITNIIMVNNAIYGIGNKRKNITTKIIKLLHR
jgi:hypothetical protein